MDGFFRILEKTNMNTTVHTFSYHSLFIYLRLQFHHTPKGDPWSYDIACYIIFGTNANGQRCSGKVSSLGVVALWDDCMAFPSEQGFYLVTDLMSFNA